MGGVLLDGALASLITPNGNASALPGETAQLIQKGNSMTWLTIIRSRFAQGVALALALLAGLAAYGARMRLQGREDARQATTENALKAERLRNEIDGDIRLVDARRELHDDWSK